jgi:hypothetical protein
VGGGGGLRVRGAAKAPGPSPQGRSAPPYTSSYTPLHTPLYTPHPDRPGGYSWLERPDSEYSHHRPVRQAPEALLPPPSPPAGPRATNGICGLDTAGPGRLWDVTEARCGPAYLAGPRNTQLSSCKQIVFLKSSQIFRHMRYVGWYFAHVTFRSLSHPWLAPGQVPWPLGPVCGVKVPHPAPRSPPTTHVPCALFRVPERALCHGVPCALYQSVPCVMY